MSDVGYRRKITDGAPVVAAPAEIDITTADQSRAALRAAHQRATVSKTGGQVVAAR
jgi:hypothetical protein